MFLGADKQTNNAAELSAAAEAILWFTQFHPLHEFPRVAIFTDSQILYDLLSGKSQPTATNSLAQKVLELIALFKASAPADAQISFVKVVSHSGDHWNDQADKLAKRGANSKASNLGRYAPPLTLPILEITGNEPLVVDPPIPLPIDTNRLHERCPLFNTSHPSRCPTTPQPARSRAGFV